MTTPFGKRTSQTITAAAAENSTVMSFSRTRSAIHRAVFQSPWERSWTTNRTRKQTCR